MMNSEVTKKLARALWHADATERLKLLSNLPDGAVLMVAYVEYPRWFDWTVATPEEIARIAAATIVDVTYPTYSVPGKVYIQLGNDSDIQHAHIVVPKPCLGCKKPLYPKPIDKWEVEDPAGFLQMCPACVSLSIEKSPMSYLVSTDQEGTRYELVFTKEAIQYVERTPEWDQVESDDELGTRPVISGYHTRVIAERKLR